jgi:hypothetical protein
VLEEKNCCASQRQDNKMECQSNGTINGGTKCTVIKTLVYEKTCLIVMLLALAIGSKLLPHMILNHKTISKKQMSTGIIVT